MKKYGIALSGGGFRAALYHLGVIRYLRDAGVLSQVSHITAVSGGSVFGAHLALNWKRYTGSDEEFQEVASELIQFLQLDIRNGIVRRFPLASLANAVRRTVRLDTKRKYTRAGLLEWYYERFLYGDAGLFELPVSPRLYVLATDLNEGSLCAFFRDGLLLQRREPIGKTFFEHMPVGLATVPMAVSASSAFPGFFPPLLLRASEVGAKPGEFGQHAFTDGGIYDNLGLRMFHHLQHSKIMTRNQVDEGSLAERQVLDTVFVSNAGATFKIQNDRRAGGLLSTAMRSSDILMDRVNQLELASSEGMTGTVFFPITKIVSNVPDLNAPHEAIQQQASRIRTDMDRFSDLEIVTLVQHGYCVARSVCLGMEFDKQRESAELWNPLLDSKTAADTELHGAENALAYGRQLQRSSTRRVFSTLLNHRDWPSYLWAPLIAFLILVIPVVAYRSHQRSVRQGYVIAAVAGTSPVYRRILELVEGGPVDTFPSVDFEEVSQIEPLDSDEVEVLSDNRIFDLRSWVDDTDNSIDEPFVHSRIRFRKTAESSAVRLQASSQDQEIKFACLTESFSPKYLRMSLPENRYLWEVSLNLSDIPVGEDVEAVFEGRLISEYAGHSDQGGRFQFSISADTGLAQIWILMPQNRKYEEFRISGFPAKQPHLRETVQPSSMVELPVGSIATFQIINPRSDYTYECRWNWAP